ncbi:hypothetical protein T03_10780 [Trichinella britovi]|uniref:Uncharacterized protein n=1 Tax=Trichinella britovi TaxID=45882 RepID=A0A0V1AI42_TRIBR|nr:hypothetical protein T03_10780 [Trichinella britovi]
MHSSHTEFEYTVTYSSAVHWLLYRTVLSHSQRRTFFVSQLFLRVPPSFESL